MRTTYEAASVRLYHLDPDSGAATTLLYGSLAEAMALAAAQDEAMQADLYLQTDNDVAAWLDLADG